VIIKADWAKYIGSDSHRNLKIQEIQKRFGLLKGIHATNIHTYTHTHTHTLKQNKEFISVFSFLTHRLIKRYGLWDVTPLNLFIGTNFSDKTATSVFSSFHFEDLSSRFLRNVSKAPSLKRTQLI
jgi:hypothetical protein